jgi:GAF domain-containing protein
MWNWIKQNILQPPAFEGDEDKTDKARLLHNFLAIIIATAIVFPIISTLGGNPVSPMVVWMILVLLATAFGLVFLVHFGFVTESGVILTLVIWGVFTFGAYSFGGLHDTSITGLLLVIVLASLIGGWRTLAIFSGLSILSLIGLYILEHTGIITPTVEIPSDAADIALPVVIVVATTFLLRAFIYYLTGAYQNARASAERLAKTNVELENSRTALAQQAATLERRTRYLEATAQVAHDIAAELDPETLLRRVVSLVSSQFGFYHTGIFLLDPAGEYAVLKAASSEGGQRMLERGHRLRAAQEGIVGYVASEGRSRVALDTGADAFYFDNPDLPKTRSEAALPLLIGRRVIGVLDVQSVEPEAFNEDIITVLQTLADQIAIALHTAQLFQQAGESLEAQRRTYSGTSRASWARFAKEEPTVGYRYLQGNVIPVQRDQTPANPELPEITLPIRLGGQVIGHITAHKPDTQNTWTEDEISVMETLIDQLGVALESARLYQETQRRAAREQLTGEVTARIRETLDIETILRTASEEIRRAFGLPEVVIQLGEPPVAPDGEEGVPA